MRRIVLLLLWTSPLWADDVVFPVQAKVVNVKQAPYNAKGDGLTDDTEAIQKALNDHPNGDFIIYLPKGTYLVSNTLFWPKGQDSAQAYRRTILQGQDQSKTVIRLAPSSRGFDNPDLPKAVLYTGLGPAPRFRNAVRDLTIKIGPENPGAIGIRFNAAIQGAISNVQVIAEDGRGAAGIDMSFAPYIGPLLVKNVEIRGFSRGIFTGSPYNGMTLEHISLFDQKEVALLNIGQMVTVRGLTVRGSVLAVRNVGPTASLAIVDSKLEHNRLAGSERGPAIINEEGAALFVRRVKIGGYVSSIQDDGSPGKGIKELMDVQEYGSHRFYALCSSPGKSLDLPVAETPQVDWGSVGNWVAITGDYGGSEEDGSDDSKAIQQAIDDGAETIFFNPGGRYTITRDVIVRKNVRRIIGVESRIDGSGRFIIEDGVPQKVVIERFGTFASGIVHNSRRTLILRHLRVKGYESREMGAGDVFLEDVSMEGPMRIHYQRVWARQLHLNWDKNTQIVNRGGDLWILGLTTTNGQTIIHTRARGKTEVLGAHIIVGPRAKTMPMFITDTSAMSIAGLRESAPNGNAYITVVQEVRPDQSALLKSSDLFKNPEGGVILPLFAGYVPWTGNNMPPSVKACPDQILVLPNWAPLTAKVSDDGRGSGYCAVPVVWNKIRGEGRVAYSHQKYPNTWVSFSYPGTYVMQIEANDGQFKRSDTTTLEVWDRRITTLDHSGNNIPSGRGADAWITEEFPQENRGKDKVLRVCNYPGRSSKAYIRFDLSALPGTIADAALQIKIRARADSLPVRWNVFGLKELNHYGEGRLGLLWAEDSIHWNNAPANNEIGGGIYDESAAQGGGVDADKTVFLGVLTRHKNPQFGYYFRSKALVKFLKNNKSRLATLILTSEPKYSVCDEAASREQGKVDPPALYVNYLDPNRSVGGEIVEGGYKMTPIEVDPFTLQVKFALLIANPQVVRIEVFNEQGERALLIQEAAMPGDTLIPYQFNARNLPTGNYRIGITGEAFRGEGRFVLLN